MRYLHYIYVGTYASQGGRWDAMGCNGMQWDTVKCNGMQWDVIGCNKMQC